MDRFIKMYPNHSSADYAWYLKGLINFNDQHGMLSHLTTPDMSDRDPKSTRESFAAFKEVVARFPDSRYAADATLRMRYLVNALASHEVHVARYYMKRGAYSRRPTARNTPSSTTRRRRPSRRRCSCWCSPTTGSAWTRCAMRPTA